MILLHCFWSQFTSHSFFYPEFACAGVGPTQLCLKSTLKHCTMSKFSVLKTECWTLSKWQNFNYFYYKAQNKFEKSQLVSSNKPQSWIWCVLSDFHSFKIVQISVQLYCILGIMEVLPYLCQRCRLKVCLCLYINQELWLTESSTRRSLIPSPGDSQTRFHVLPENGDSQGV